MGPPTPGPGRTPQDFGDAFARLLAAACITIDALLGDPVVGSVVTRSTLYDWKNSAHLPGSTGQLIPVVRRCLERIKERDGTPPDGLSSEQEWLNLLADAKQSRDDIVPAVDSSARRRRPGSIRTAEGWNRSHLDVLQTLMEMEDSADREVKTFIAETAAHLPLEDPGYVDAVLRELRDKFDATEAVSALICRDIASHVRMDADGLSYLLSFLRDEGAAHQIKRLLDRNPAASVPISSAYEVSRLLNFLLDEGATAQITELLKRNPATHSSLNGADNLLKALSRAGDTGQVSKLATRAAERSRIDDPHYVGIVYKHSPRLGLTSS